MASLFERKFVFLSPEDKGYEIAIGRTPKGHIEIEKKDGRLSLKIFVENLKEMVYQIQLFTFGGSHVILDEISIGNSGRQEGKYNTSSQDVFNSGISWQEFDVIVIRPLGQEHSRKVPLIAWLNNGKDERRQIPYIIEENDYGLKENEMKDEQENQKSFQEEDPFDWELDRDHQTEESIEEYQEIEQEIEEEKQEWQIGQQEIGKDNVQEEEVQEILEENIGDRQEPYSQAEGYWVDFDEDKGEEHPETEREEEPPYYYITENIPQLERMIPEIKPFDPPIKNHKWWKVMDYQSELDRFYLYYNDSFVNLTYPYMGYKNIGEVYAEEYNHMIFGVVFDENIEKKLNYYVYGIPGRLCMQDQPFQGNTGYLYWHPGQGNEKEKGQMGYWLLYIEAHSGIIAVPKRPTIAPVCDE